MNRSTFSELHRRYWQRLVFSMTGFTRHRETAEDVASKAFAAAYENLRRFRDDASFYTWVHSIAINEARGQWRRKRGLRFVALETPEARSIADPVQTEESIEREDCCRRVRDALQHLPRRYRRLATNVYMKGDSLKTAARRQRLPYGTVMSRLFNGRQMLRRHCEVLA